ncbi:Cof-type HAD-IIB family hydrolase [Bacillus sp. DNRA2]|uniref:Cof-type HAD-IIB family hydrolase n=1 Tax=Bacillus sp. DNRA2 TaxID=2723053 RepID=UPI00145CD326|nr:Cof-type HAD-IIB family hydrolase [Bacillus sp. DNRA2]NMD71922.1 Cof-type HAD-IIB family hydrolase [Bacillus sp. DNRA2]
MMKEIIFFDIDGTILNHDKQIPSKTKQAIKDLREQGHFVAIATGRAPFMFEELRQELEIDSYVSFNGQFVVFENKLLYHNPLNKEELHRLHQYSNNLDHPLVFMNQESMKSSVPHHRYIEESMKTLQFSHPEHDDLFYQDKHIFQSLLFVEEREEYLYEGRFPDFQFVRWHPFSVDVIPKGGSKAEGIKRMVDILGMNMKDVYAFGDGLNDIEMLQTVGTGVVMGNASDEVKQHGNFITKPVDEDGIWFGLKELGLI